MPCTYPHPTPPICDYSRITAFLESPLLNFLSQSYTEMWFSHSSFTYALLTSLKNLLVTSWNSPCCYNMLTVLVSVRPYGLCCKSLGHKIAFFNIILAWLILSRKLKNADNRFINTYISSSMLQDWRCNHALFISCTLSLLGNWQLYIVHKTTFRL